MTVISTSVTYNLSALRALRTKTDMQSDELIAWQKRSAQKYRSFLYHRFNTFSRGGGDWKQTNKNKTRRKSRDRRRGKFILRSSHTLFKSLSPVFRGLPGQHEKITPEGIEVGIEGGQHPSGPITIGELARIHHNGEGIQDARKIIVRPDSKLRTTLADDLGKAIRRG